MTDIMKLADAYATKAMWNHEVSDEMPERFAVQSAIEALQEKCALLEGTLESRERNIEALLNKNFAMNNKHIEQLLRIEANVDKLIEERDAYQQAADKMAAEHKVERESLERQIKIKDGEAEMYKSYWKQATDANRRIRNVA